MKKKREDDGGAKGDGQDVLDVRQKIMTDGSQKGDNHEKMHRDRNKRKVTLTNP